MSAIGPSLVVLINVEGVVEVGTVVGIMELGEYCRDKDGIIKPFELKQYNKTKTAIRGGSIETNTKQDWLNPRIIQQLTLWFLKASLYENVEVVFRL